MEPSDERDLLARVPAGDDAAFEELYRQYSERLRLTAWRLSRRSELADDLANEAWVRAYRARPTYDSTRPFISWLGGILHNVWREHARSSSNDPTGRRGGSDADAAGVADGAIPLEQAVAEAEILAALNDCVERLDADAAQMIRWRFFENLSLRAVAQRLGIAEATVREVRLPAAVAKVERCLRAKGVSADIFSFSTAQGGEGTQ